MKTIHNVTLKFNKSFYNMNKTKGFHKLFFQIPKFNFSSGGGHEHKDSHSHDHGHGNEHGHGHSHVKHNETDNDPLYDRTNYNKTLGPEERTGEERF